MTEEKQEFEFIMEGITTRMQIAMEKISESNKMLRSTVKYVCLSMLIVIAVVVSGFLMNNRLWFEHMNDLKSGVSAGEVVSASEGEEVFQFRKGANDR